MALDWEDPFDPDETLDYARDWTAEMDAVQDTITTVSFVLPQEAVDAALIVQSENVDETNKIAIVWFTSTDPEQTRAIVGTKVGVDHTITTAGGRTYNETIRLSIREK